jgi:hypothetical protein
MKKIIFLWPLLTLLLLPSVSLAVSFDCWETGMGINEVVRVAQEHDFPIARDGVIHLRKGFDPKLIDDKFFKASVVYYRTTLAGRNAAVYLRFTDEPKFIREIVVRVYRITDREIFTDEMLGILSNKYGSYRELQELFEKAYEWRPDPDSRIVLRVGSGKASITYSDLKINKDFEDRRKQQEKESIRKDAGKY